MLNSPSVLIANGKKPTNKINHLVENTKSYQLVKSVLENKSRSVYQGKTWDEAKIDGSQYSAITIGSQNTSTLYVAGRHFPNGEDCEDEEDESFGRSCC